MRVFKLKRETCEGQFSLENWQLYVGEISDSKNNRYKGMSILGAHGMVEFPFIVSPENASKLIFAINSTLTNQFPSKFKLKTGSHFLTFSYYFKEFITNWHGGGGYKGVIGLSCFGLGSAIYATVTKNTLISLRDCLAKFYGLSNGSV